MSASSSSLAAMAPTGRDARLLMRSGRYGGHTAGMAPGHVQGNLAILPKAQADDFLRFCQRNPKPCPLLAVSEPGDPASPTLGADIDIRGDLPLYRIWRDDLASFVIGCSFSFEEALLEAGVPLRHVAEGRNVAMYRTNLPTIASF
jgi:uncharacterized protein YcsI (UPF0317 family)